MTTTASLELGAGEGRVSGDWLLIFPPGGPLPRGLAPLSHTQLTDCPGAEGEGCWEPPPIPGPLPTR